MPQAPVEVTLQSFLLPTGVGRLSVPTALTGFPREARSASKASPCSVTFNLGSRPESGTGIPMTTGCSLRHNQDQPYRTRSSLTARAALRALYRWRIRSRIPKHPGRGERGRSLLSWVFPSKVCPTTVRVRSSSRTPALRRDPKNTKALSDLDHSPRLRASKPRIRTLAS